MTHLSKVYEWFKWHWQTERLEPIADIGFKVYQKLDDRIIDVMVIDPARYETIDTGYISNYLDYCQHNNFYPLILFSRGLFVAGGLAQVVEDWVKGLHTLYYGRIYSYALDEFGNLLGIIPLHFKYNSRYPYTPTVEEGPIIFHKVAGLELKVNDTNGDWNAVYTQPNLNIATFLDNTFWKARESDKKPKGGFKYGAAFDEWQELRNRTKEQPRYDDSSGQAWESYRARSKRERNYDFKDGPDPNQDPQTAWENHYKHTGRFENYTAFIVWWLFTSPNRGETAYSPPPKPKKGPNMEPPKKAAFVARGRLSEFEAYEVLGLTRSATLKEAQAAFRALSRQYHPDSAGADNLEAIEHFKEVSIAWGIIERKLRS